MRLHPGPGVMLDHQGRLQAVGRLLAAGRTNLHRIHPVERLAGLETLASVIDGRSQAV